jgi:hypothetical protein
MDKETNAELFNKVAIINKETKKKPHNITIKNNNPNEPKINIDMKYSDNKNIADTKPKLNLNYIIKL